MILGIGIDLVEANRFLDWSPFKRQRVFTKKELEFSEADSSGGERHLANFWAAREAILKAIGCGFGDDIQFSDVSVIHADNGRPEAVLVGGAKIALKALSPDARVHISITDQGAYCAAVAVVSD
jgi:holo-[acyl-carrier protein] synthase